MAVPGPWFGQGRTMQVKFIVSLARAWQDGSADMSHAGRLQVKHVPYFAACRHMLQYVLLLILLPTVVHCRCVRASGMHMA